MSALRIGKAAEQKGWSTLEQTWPRTWPCQQGNPSAQVDFKGKISFFTIPDASFQKWRELYLTDLMSPHLLPCHSFGEFENND